MTEEQELLHWKNMVKLYKFDSLTGLKMRRDFEVETMHKMTKQSFYLAMFDVDGLHQVNREKGFEFGDALIRQVSMEIQSTKALWECYRIGGDEFIALYFDEPDFVINNATSAYIHSSECESLSDLIKSVDAKVIEKKEKLKRRRDDDDDDKCLEGSR